MKQAPLRGLRWRPRDSTGTPSGTKGARRDIVAPRTFPRDPARIPSWCASIRRFATPSVQPGTASRCLPSPRARSARARRCAGAELDPLRLRAGRRGPRREDQAGQPARHRDDDGCPGEQRPAREDPVLPRHRPSGGPSHRRRRDGPGEWPLSRGARGRAVPPPRLRMPSGRWRATSRRCPDRSRASATKPLAFSSSTRSRRKATVSGDRARVVPTACRICMKAPSTTRTAPVRLGEGGHGLADPGPRLEGLGDERRRHPRRRARARRARGCGRGRGRRPTPS